MVSFFLLTGAFLVIIGLFHWGLRYSTIAQAQQRAVLIAEEKLTEIRAWARQPTAGGFNFDDWTPYLNSTTPDPHDPSYTVQVRSQPQPLVSPCTTFELPHASGADQRKLSTSVMKVQVTVRWGTRHVDLATLVADPTRELRTTNPIVVSEISAPSPLARNTTAEYRVYGYDSNDLPIRDLMFNWNVKLGNSNGTIQQRRDGSLANVTNAVTIPLQPTLYTGGTLTLQARTSYRGQPASGESTALSLTP